MTAPVLTINQPVHGAGFHGAALVSLRATLSGSPSGLFFKWFSSLNAAATADHPELNVSDHSAAILDWSAPLAEFGSHVIVLAATDRDGIDLASIKSVARSAMAGGAPPAAVAPCVVHRLLAQLRRPATNGQVFAKAASTFEFLAPARWAREDPAHSGSWIADRDYQQINGISLRLRLAPAGAPDLTHTADIPLDLAALAFFRADDQTWFRWSGSLPGNVSSGNYTLSLTVSGGGTSTSVTRQVVVAA
ncbi:MAG: hypothetical protein AW10_02776 [Candidatus Accumulibacter appositus]|uniref:Uncharacterized protein n=1 Tax=Candidatus Accumulibacter appositus TaxID=1454003 RepID=A0A011NTU3_9PROT|nr:hypothetical protein [Accumulibacter sp.]EXI78786.1 MAG: hypothetical protein AW10_02776 [Candidatus Accumulibacter appositus]HRF05796.1 hypothetical protein [Accumulibacter sp.]